MLQRVKEKWPEILVIFLCMILLAIGIGKKEGFEVDEMLSLEFANAKFNPWIVPYQPEGRLAKYVRLEIEGENLVATLGNIIDTVVDVLENGDNSKLMSYEADVYAEPVWIAAETFYDYIYVDSGDAFNYLSVYFNMLDDTHPFFYFMLLHTLCSIFQGQSLIFVGCLINMAAVAVSMIYIMKSAHILATKLGIAEYGRGLGIFAAALFGCSMGAMTIAILIRMYGLLTCFCVLSFYVHLKKWTEGSFASKNLGLILVTLLGFLTQYFFLFYCLTIAVVISILLLFHRRFRELFTYIGSMLVAAVIGVVSRFMVIRDVFHSSRGMEAVGNLKEGLAGYGERLKGFFVIVAENTYGVVFVIVLAVAALILVIRWLIACGKRTKNKVLAAGRAEGRELSGSRKEEKALSGSKVEKMVLSGGEVEEKQLSGGKGEDALLSGEGTKEKTGYLSSMALLCVPALVYFLLAARMSPYTVDRYIMPVFPFVIMIGAVIVVKSVALWKNKDSKMLVMRCTCGAIIVFQLCRLLQFEGFYWYKGYDEQRKLAEEYASYPCICIYVGSGFYHNLLEFTSYERTLLLTEWELESRTVKTLYRQGACIYYYGRKIWYGDEGAFNEWGSLWR